GIPSVMLLTDLDAVLGTSVGSAVEVQETVDFLSGACRDPRAKELVVAVTAEMIVLAGVAPDIVEARALAEARLDDGSAAERFDRMIAALGGPADFVARAADILPEAAVIRPVVPETNGYVAGMNAKAVGLALIAIGGGRKRPGDPIDLTVGFTDFCQVGDTVGADRPLCVLHTRNEAEWEEGASRIRAAVEISATEPSRPGPIVIDRIERRP
ncbi:MAG: thymidine phosphorylase, partial [Hyphomicrobiales bacterium]|nr:thymidine phosphorylase [Hyphomicrobiales bacterium]